MAWWLEGAIFRHFGSVRNPSKTIFCIFLESGKKSKKKKFQEKSVFIGKIGDFSLIFFFSNFSIPISFPAPPKSDFSPKNRSKSTIFLSMIVLDDLWVKEVWESVRLALPDGNNSRIIIMLFFVKNVNPTSHIGCGVGLLGS